jgi:hypothetical protein
LRICLLLTDRVAPWIVLVNVLSYQRSVILLVSLDVKKIHDGLFVRVEAEKLTLHSWVIKHLIDLFGIQSAAYLLLSVLVTRLAVHSIHDIIKGVPLRVAVSSSTAFDSRNHFA